MSLLHDAGLNLEQDKNHYLRDWSSNLDGHLMAATDMYLGNGKQDYDSFKLYMREVLSRPYVSKDDLEAWFSSLRINVEGDAGLREEALKELQAELR
jgi:hypothetical protein